MQRSTKGFLIRMKPPKTGTFYISNIFIDSPLHSLAGNGIRKLGIIKKKKKKRNGTANVDTIF